jgi:trimethylamine:corrinoid methyltransferase-like protein
MSPGAGKPATTSAQPPTTPTRRPLTPLVDPAIRLEVLDAAALDRIHAATLELIETVGVRFPSARAQAIWADHGAQVDPGTGIVRVPGHLIEAALRSAPAVFTLAGREPERDLPLDGHHVWAATDGCGVEVADLATGERRRSTLDDVASICRVAEELPDVGFIWMPVSAQDVPPESRALRELAAALSITTKHVQTESVMHPREAAVAVEMALALAGGRAALRARPPLSLTFCTISPLAHEAGALDAALVAAEAGIPTGFMTMASCAHTGPATLAGTLAVGNAEVLSALALVELAVPGAPVYYAAAQTAMDLRTGAYTGGGPEDVLFGLASGELAERYQVPLSMGAFATGAHVPDWRAGLENGLAALAACVGRADMLLGMGLLAGSRIWSYEQLLLDAEILGLVRGICRGIPVDDESLALDVIRAVGPGGDFLAEPHTRRHMRERWSPALIDRRPPAPDGTPRVDARERAHSRALELLATAPGAPLDPALAAELVRIAETAGEPGR